MDQVTKYDRLLTAFRSGAELTAKQIKSRFGVSQPYHLIYRLRENGFQVETNERTNSKGETKSFYKLIETKRKRKAA